MHALPGHGPLVGGQDIDLGTTGAAGDDHAFAQAELHLAWGEIGNHDY